MKQTYLYDAFVDSTKTDDPSDPRFIRAVRARQGRAELTVEELKESTRARWARKGMTKAEIDARMEAIEEALAR